MEQHFYDTTLVESVRQGCISLVNKCSNYPQVHDSAFLVSQSAILQII